MNPENNFPFRDGKYPNYDGKKSIEKEVNRQASALFPDDFMINSFAFASMLRRKTGNSTKLVWSVLFPCFNQPNPLALQLFLIREQNMHNGGFDNKQFRWHTTAAKIHAACRLRHGANRAKRVGH